MEKIGGQIDAGVIWITRDIYKEIGGKIDAGVTLSYKGS